MRGARAYVEQPAVAHQLERLCQVSCRLRTRRRVAVRCGAEQRGDSTRLGHGLHHGAERLVGLIADEAVRLTRLLDEDGHNEVKVRLHLVADVGEELTEAHHSILRERRAQRVRIPNEQQINRVEMRDHAAIAALVRPRH